MALAAVAWADGKLDPDEADAIVRAAVDEGLALEEIAEIEAATKTKVDLGVIDRSGLGKEDRLFVYAVACWIARLDGQVTAGGERRRSRSSASGSASRSGRACTPRPSPREVAEMPEGDRPARYDLAALRRILGERLRDAQAAAGRTEARLSRTPARSTLS